MAILCNTHRGEAAWKYGDGERHRRRLPQALPSFVLVVLALIASVGLPVAMSSPAQRIGNELRAAASQLQSSVPAPRETTLDEIHRDFRDHDVTVDAADWPNVRVTFHHLDLDTCREASTRFARIEGLVVIMLEPSRDLHGCADSGDLTWRIMP